MLKRRIPTIIGIVLLIAGALAGVMFINRSTGFLPRASPEYIPQKINLTNITDTSFTASWVTQEPAIGFVKYGENAGNLTTITVDERDQLTGDSGEYRTHYVSVLGLKPQTTYYFKLGSQGKRLYDNNGQSLSITTGPTLGDSPSADTVYGTIMTPAQTPAEGAIIYLSFPDSNKATPLSSLVKQNGSWALSLSTTRTADLTGFVQYDPQTTTLTFLSRSTINDDTTAVTTTALDQPVPVIILGTQQDFRNLPIDVAPSLSPENTPTPPPASKFSLTPVTVTEPKDDPTIVINTLPKNDLTIKDVQPEIQGKAPPGTALTITIHSSTIYTDSVNSDETGRWTWTPPGYLSPGEHTLSISYTDQQGILHTLSRTFIVEVAASAGNNLPAYTATPSAAIAPTYTPNPTNIPTRAPLPSATVKPTPSTAPTSIPIPSQKPTTRPTLIPSPSPTPHALPTAGTTIPTFTLILLGSFFCLIGILFTLIYA